MGGYEGLRFVFGLLAAVGWLSAGGGVVIAVTMLLAGSGWQAAVGVNAFWGGILIVAFAGVGRLVCDLNARIDALTRAMEAGRPAPQPLPVPTSTSAADKPPPWPMGLIEVYKGVQITGTMRSVQADNHRFASLADARLHIDALPAIQGNQ